MVNPSKHHGVILGRTDHFSFPVKDSIERFRVTLDKELNFKQHVTSVRKKVNNQLSVMTRFGKLLSLNTMPLVYKAFILLHFYYSVVLKRAGTTTNLPSSHMILSVLKCLKYLKDLFSLRSSTYQFLKMN